MTQQQIADFKTALANLFNEHGIAIIPVTDYGDDSYFRLIPAEDQDSWLSCIVTADESSIVPREDTIFDSTNSIMVEDDDLPF